MDVTLLSAPTRTPPLPPRSVYRDSFPPRSPRDAELIPKPLFSGRTDLPPTSLHGLTHTTPRRPSKPRTPLPTLSTISDELNASPSKPGLSSSRPSPQSFVSRHWLSPQPTAIDSDSNWKPLPLSRRILRRKRSPKTETLRALRAKESDASLQKVYSRQLDAYLNGTLFDRVAETDELDSVDE